MPKLNIGIKKEDLEKTGIKLSSDYSDVFSLIFIGELHLKNPVSGGLGVSKLTVINYGAYKQTFTCLVTEFLMSSFDGIKKFKNYKYMPCESMKEVHKQLKVLTENEKEDNAEYLASILDELLTNYFNSEKKL
tara:strand:+ start:709 stop:1107 length:399 start_codon:yes stop_codon:yes gene_type:complete